MTTRDTPPIDWEASDVEPAEAFALLADANRFDLIKVIAEAEQSTLSFNTFYDRSNFDDSGQFNYHLDKLVGPFIRKTADGYELRHAAKIVYRLVVSGLLSDRGEAELTTVETPCPECDAASLTAVYEGDRFWVRCEGCGRRSAVSPFPPRALLNYEPDRAPTAFDRYTMGAVFRASENVCPWCASPFSASLDPADDSWPTVDWVIHRSCNHCQGWFITRIQDLIRLHPAAISFYYERGIDILGSSFWEVENLLSDQTVVVDESDDWAARVTLTHDGDTLEIGLADDLRVSTIEVL